MELCVPVGHFPCGNPMGWGQVVTGELQEDPHFQSNGVDAMGWIQSLQQGGLERNLDGFKLELPFCWDTFELQTALLMVYVANP